MTKSLKIITVFVFKNKQEKAMNWATHFFFHSAAFVIWIHSLRTCRSRPFQVTKKANSIEFASALDWGTIFLSENFTTLHKTLLILLIVLIYCIIN